MSLTLPIDSLRTAFLTHLSQHHLVVTAETGSGKSTRLPVWAAEHGRVLVVEPRRVACRSLAEFVAAERHEAVGDSVGYAIRFENYFSEQTQVVFVTPGVALRWMTENRLADFKTVIVDEFHERRWDTDLLLAMLKTLDNHRLVVTSATLDSERLTRYLGGRCLSAEGRQFHVDVRHLASDSRNMPEARHIESRVKEVLLEHYQSHRDILVFLPGRKEISQCSAMLGQALRDQIEMGLVDVIALHSSVSDQERLRALTPSDKQRIILATNVAETSLTIPGVTLIIDTGLERRTHQRNGRTVLGVHAISRASAEQRKGRAGRVADGLCLRLYGKAAPLELITPPELQREELVEPMLAAACSGYRLDALPFVDSVPDKSLAAASEKLQQMMAIDPQGEVTEHGRILYPLPIDTLFAHLITAMPDKASREAMVDLAASLSVYQKIWTPPGNEETCEKLAKWEPCHCDAMALIKMVRITDHDSLPEWLDVDKATLAEAQMLSTQMREALQLPDLDVATTVRREPWLKAVMQAAPELVYVRREKRRQALGNGYAEVSIGRDSRFADDAEAAIIFDQFALAGKKGLKQNLVLATCMAPVPLGYICELDMAQTVLGDSIATDEGIRVEHRRVYAGRVISSSWQSPEGESAARALLEMVWDGLLLEGLAERVRADIHQWNLYLALGRYQPEACTRPATVVDAKQWLTEQIETLGVESEDDLALFSADEFVFEGIPQWEREDFDSEFPYQVKLNDLTMAVEYHIGRKLVVAVYQSGGRKADPKRWELPRWQGWKVQYRKASRTIDVR
ncbi:DEAD/DEAH box helicase [Photobacterium aquae]|uniref:DEAD/DEAH box helicase n=1 Tax=Photobacterium aquae TaxID=1195763 RepID=A0A0J1JK08_9GAMM|nr:helicase-related protein [Photobacterium aquae]KLV02337.1 DEAD/DEAH box helicase [Photobacterium aquae]